MTRLLVLAALGLLMIPAVSIAGPIRDRIEARREARTCGGCGQSAGQYPMYSAPQYIPAAGPQMYCAPQYQQPAFAAPAAGGCVNGVCTPPPRGRIFSR